VSDGTPPESSATPSLSSTSAPRALGTPPLAAVPAVLYEEWIVNCLPNQCVHGTLVMRFASEIERDAWAESHETKLGHRVQRTSKLTPFAPPKSRERPL
jgi:hypothetical protein